MEFTADLVWGLAVAADRINGGYIKEQVVVYEGECRKVINEPNKHMVKTWLREGQFSEATAADIEKGREVRSYFNGFLLKQIKGKINDFEQQALKIAQMDEFTGRNLFEFSVVSCLPSVMLRDQARNDLTRDIYYSEQLAADEGETIVGDITVVSSRYNSEYDKYSIKARFNDSFVSFFFGADLQKDATLRIKAKVKAHRSDKTTQLNYVKKI